jgi:arylsulfatase
VLLHIRRAAPRLLAPAAAVVALLLASAAPSRAVEPAPVRNLVLVSIDSLRADHLSLYGYPRHTTPSLERYVERRGAQIYDRVTAAAASCHPSHTAILTGLYPQQVGVPGCAEDMLRAEDESNEEWEASLLRTQSDLQRQPPALVRKHLSAVMNWLAIPEDAETLATFLQRHGFRTGGFTSIWTVERRFGYARGFDVFVDRMPEYYGPARLGWLLKDLMHAQRRQVGEITVDNALEFLDSLRADDRFFAFVHLADTHAPYAPRTAPTFEESAAERGRLEAVWRARYSDATYERAMRRMGRGTSAFLLDHYDRAILYDDSQLGRILASLEAHGRLDDTLVVVLSDHGDSMGQHFYLSPSHEDRLFFEHSVQVWEETQHVPLIVLDPARRGGAERDARNVSQVDIVPTVLDRLGLSSADFGTGPLPGTSLARAGSEQRIVYFLTFGRGRPGIFRHLELDYPKFIGFRRGDTKFFVDGDRFKSAGAGRCFLYDLDHDPDELDNRCDANAANAATFREVLVDWYSGAAIARDESRRRPTPASPRERREGRPVAPPR